MNRLIKHRENIGDYSNNSDTQPALGAPVILSIIPNQLLMIIPFPFIFTLFITSFRSSFFALSSDNKTT